MVIMEKKMEKNKWFYRKGRWIFIHHEKAKPKLWWTSKQSSYPFEEKEVTKKDFKN